jgi:hypothetical protein
MPVYDNDYQPARPQESSFNGHIWQQPFRNIAESRWRLDKADPTKFYLNSPADEINSLIYDTSLGNDFRATYAYDSVGDYKHMPHCSDLMLRFYARSDVPRGCIGIVLSKYQTIYKGWVDFSGDMVIAKVSEGKETVLDSKIIDPSAINKLSLVKFANVDHQLIFQFGSDKLTYDLGCFAEDAGARKAESQPEVRVFGSGTLTLSHVAIFRDIHYISKKSANSPNSEDGRWWSRPGIGNNGLSYKEGIVPRDYLVGKALFVYWPGGFGFPWPDSLKTSLLKSSRHNALSKIMYWFVSWQWIPCIGQMRFIRGGTSG